MLRRIYWGLLAVVLTISLSSCIRYPRFTFGQISPVHSCISIFPLMNLNVDNAEENLVSEYLTLAMRDAGFKGAMGPGEVKELFRSSGIEMPTSIDQNDAFRIGQELSADAVLYGHGSKFTLQSSSSSSDNPDVLLGIDLYLLDVRNNSINWIYTTRIYSNIKDYLVDLSKLSVDVSRTLLASGTVTPVSTADECWDRRKIALALTGAKKPVQASAPKVVSKPPVAKKQAPKKAPALRKAPTVKPPSSVAKASPPNLRKKAVAKQAAAPKRKAVVLSGKARTYREVLNNTKRISIRGLFDGRSTQLNSGALDEITGVGQALSSYSPSTKFVFEGHIDATSNSSDDFWVSAQQASKLRDQIVKRFPNLKGRIEIAAKGGSSPLVPNINKRSRKRNHRIEIRRVAS